MTITIQELINQTHKARISQAALKAAEDKLRLAYETSPEYAAYITAKNARAASDGVLNTLIETLKVACIAHFRSTGETKIMDVINLKNEPTVGPYDIPQAVAWCKENSPITITTSVDKAAFEALVMAGKVPWVEVIKVPKVTKVASDFSKVAIMDTPEAEDGSKN